MNSKSARKRSRTTYPASKMSKLSNADVPSKEAAQPAPMPPYADVNSSTDVDHDAIPAGDWLTAICQSLGEVPAVYETSNDIHPQLFVDIASPLPTDAHTGPDTQIPKTQLHDETNPLQMTGVQDSAKQLASNESAYNHSEVNNRNISKTQRTWILNDCLQVSLLQTGYKLHIHLNQCSIVEMNCYVSKSGIMMNIPTYIDFKDKIHRVNTTYPSSSAICNNQLALFSRKGELVLQQIFHVNEFKLKLNPLHIDCYTLNKIREIIYDIDKAIEEALVYYVLPEKILEKSVLSPSSHPDLMQEFIAVIQNEVETNVFKLFQCAGCEIDDPSQFNHDCMMHTYDTKYSRYGTNAFLMLDVKNVVNELQSKNILQCFSKDFFSSLYYSKMESDLMKVSDY